MKNLKLHDEFSKELIPIDDDIFNTINDILYDLKDNGFDVYSEKGKYSQYVKQLKFGGNYRLKSSINIDIDKDGDMFYVEEIMECIKRIDKYAKTINLKITMEYDDGLDFLSISDFLEEYSEEEISRIGIIIHD